MDVLCYSRVAEPNASHYIMLENNAFEIYIMFSYMSYLPPDEIIVNGDI